jgi:RHS repeat-associated protein
VLGVYVYQNGKWIWEEQHLYGVVRLGMLVPQLTIESVRSNDLYDDQNNDHTEDAGRRLYELTNHLGNVLVTVSDEKVQAPPGGPSIDYFDPHVISAQDYYPFGMIQPERNFNVSGYRYGFNGQERSDEIDGNSFSALFWEYDSRIGRRWNVDPVTKSMISPYEVLGNNPISYIDPLGNDPDKGNGKGKINYESDRMLYASVKTTIHKPRNWLRWPSSTFAERKGWERDWGNYLKGNYVGLSSQQMKLYRGRDQATKEWKQNSIAALIAFLGPAAVEAGGLALAESGAVPAIYSQFHASALRLATHTVITYYRWAPTIGAMGKTMAEFLDETGSIAMERAAVTKIALGVEVHA